MGYQLEASALGTVLPIEWGALSQRQRTNSKTDMKGPRASKTGQAGRRFSQERFFFSTETLFNNLGEFNKHNY